MLVFGYSILIRTYTDGIERIFARIKSYLQTLPCVYLNKYSANFINIQLKGNICTFFLV